jgi:hypothetical protein
MKRYGTHQGFLYWKILPHQGGGGNISRCHMGGKKYENAKKKKGENMKEKGRKGK